MRRQLNKYCGNIIMKSQQFKNEEEFNAIFNFNLQPRAIKSVNGIAVNIDGGSLIYNTLEVTNKAVTIESYFVDKQGYTKTFIKAPFIVEY